MKRNIRVLVVEDEYITLDILKDFLISFGYEVSGDAMSADEAIEVLEKGETDIAILDINLKGEKNGIWIADQIKNKYHIPFIFLTAYSDRETVEKAGDLLPYGYLLKPFNKADLFTSIEIALKNFAAYQSYPIHTAYQTEESIIGENIIFVKDNLIYKKIILSEIKFIEAFSNYIELNFEGYRVVVRSTLQTFYSKLPEGHFLQPHRSFIVNIKSVDIIGTDFLMIGNKKIPISKNHKAEFTKHFSFL